MANEQIQTLVASRLEPALAAIAAKTRAEIEASERHAEAARIARLVELEQRELMSMKAREKLERRMRAACRGIANLHELGRVPELPALARLCMNAHYRMVEGAIDDSEFIYYSASDDQEYTQVRITAAAVIVDFGGADACYRGRIEFLATDTDEELMAKLEEIASHMRYRPFVVRNVFDRPGDNGDLGAIAFQVLIESANPRRMEEYFADATASLPRN